MLRQRLWPGEEVHRQLEAVGTFHGPSRQLVQGGQHGIDARQRVRLGPAQRREPQDDKSCCSGHRSCCRSAR
jgi:hypothetical protein